MKAVLLSSCRVTAEQHLIVGRGGITKIFLTNDGCGPMGHYDRIHIEYDDGSEIIVPAHQALAITRGRGALNDGA